MTAPAPRFCSRVRECCHGATARNPSRRALASSMSSDRRHERFPLACPTKHRSSTAAPPRRSSFRTHDIAWNTVDFRPKSTRPLIQTVVNGRIRRLYRREEA